jgi:hypothetical protein
MARRGAHARDTGSTTGIATAVLALLSAGTLASLGLVTADELRGGSTGSLRSPYSELLPPLDVVVTPTPTPTPRVPGSGPSGSGGSGQPVVGPFEPAAVTGGVDGSGPTLAASGPGVAEPGAPIVAVAPPLPPGPVFSSLDPAPAPAPSVLAVKHGKAVGHAHAHGQAHKATKPAGPGTGTVMAAATPTSLTFLGVTPAASGSRLAHGEHAHREHGRAAHTGTKHTDSGHSGSGHSGSGHGRAAHHSPGAITDPALPAAAAAAAVAPADPNGPGNGHGHAYGHDKA